MVLDFQPEDSLFAILLPKASVAIYPAQILHLHLPKHHQVARSPFRAYQIDRPCSGSYPRAADLAVVAY